MNSDREKSLAESIGRSPYWVCLVVFLALIANEGFRAATLIDQRKQLNRVRDMHLQNAAALVEAQQLETRLQMFSLDLLQVAKTNVLAKRIVQDFNIQWNPTSKPAQAAPALPATNASK